MFGANIADLSYQNHGNMGDNWHFYCDIRVFRNIDGVQLIQPTLWALGLSFGVEGFVPNLWPLYLGMYWTWWQRWDFLGRLFQAKPYWVDRNNHTIVVEEGYVTWFVIWLVVWNMKFILPYIGNNNPNYPQLTFIFFRGVETTNQLYMICYVHFWMWNATSGWSKGKKRPCPSNFRVQ
jgi:hypothetical protein